jgi:hypothetical protein
MNKSILFTKEVALHLLKGFLISEGAYTRFCENIANENVNLEFKKYKNIDQLFRWMENNEDDYSLSIYAAFLFRLSPEGYGYWFNISKKFRCLINQI